MAGKRQHALLPVPDVRYKYAYKFRPRSVLVLRNRQLFTACFGAFGCACTIKFAAISRYLHNQFESRTLVRLNLGSDMLEEWADGDCMCAYCKFAQWHGVELA